MSATRAHGRVEHSRNPSNLAREHDMNHLLTTREVAERCRVSDNTVRYWRHARTGPPGGFKVGKRVLYPERKVTEWLLERQRIDDDQRR